MPAADPNALVAPAHVVEGPNGSVIADSSKIVTPEPKDESRPAWLDEKFKSPEDLATAYKELEKKLGQKPADTPAPTPTLADAQAKGVDVAKLQQEYAAKGELSAESLAALEKAGITKDHVKQYVDGLKAQSDQIRGEFAELAGGDEQLGNVLEWAKTNLSADEAAAYDALIDGGHTAAAKMVFKSIVERYASENGETPALIEAETVASLKGVKPFESQMQVVDAMKNPKYQTDEAYRQNVAKRLAVTTAF